jgi:hypothetical protein
VDKVELDSLPALPFPLTIIIPPGLNDYLSRGTSTIRQSVATVPRDSVPPHSYNLNHTHIEQGVELVTHRSCIREEPSSNLRRTTDIFTVSSVSLQASTRTLSDGTRSRSTYHHHSRSHSAAEEAVSTIQISQTAVCWKGQGSPRHFLQLPTDTYQKKQRS